MHAISEMRSFSSFLPVLLEISASKQILSSDLPEFGREAGAARAMGSEVGKKGQAGASRGGDYCKSSCQADIKQ
jgi:hypothetical protein